MRRRNLMGAGKSGASRMVVHISSGAHMFLVVWAISKGEALGLPSEDNIPLSDEQGDVDCEIHDLIFDDHCGCNVCVHCGYHEGLARCFCGWAIDGGNGRTQLEELGEQIDDDY
jgi:hypothetical protein